jgi:hypothetical protein
MRYLSFDNKHLKILLYLISIDLIATMVWYFWFEIPEANPVLCGAIESSLVKFVILKLALSFPGLYLLSKYIDKILAQLGIGILLAAYMGITIVHYIIFLYIISGQYSI